MSIPQVGNPGLNLQAAGGARESPRSVAAANTAVGNGSRGNPRTSPAADAAPEQRANPEQLKEAIQQMNRAMRVTSSALEFSVDQDTDRVVVTMTDRDTGEVVMQIPSEQTLALARYLDAASKGALLSQKA